MIVRNAHTQEEMFSPFDLDFVAFVLSVCRFSSYYLLLLLLLS